MYYTCIRVSLHSGMYVQQLSYYKFIAMALVDLNCKLHLIRLFQMIDIIIFDTSTEEAVFVNRGLSDVW